MFSKKRDPQVIHLYTIGWNEEYMLKYFFKHYDPIVDRYVIFDDGSTDNSLALLGQHPKVEIRPLPRLKEVDSFILSAKEIHNNAWKESRGKADWVIYTAIDELLYHPDLRGYLKECTAKGVTVVPALGYQMISRELPQADEPLVQQVKSGCAWANMNKLSIYNPDKIKETRHIEGRHAAAPQGKVVYPATDEVLNLHFKYLSIESTFKRHAELQNKLGALDIKNEWGKEYGWEREKFMKSWDFFEQNAVANVFDTQYNAPVAHSPLSERWWRKDVNPYAPPKKILSLKRKLALAIAAAAGIGFILWLLVR